MASVCGLLNIKSHRVHARERSSYRHNAPHCPSPSVISLHAGDDRAHGSSDRKHLAASLSLPLPRAADVVHPALLLTTSQRIPCLSCSCVFCFLSFPVLLDPWSSLACARRLPTRSLPCFVQPLLPGGVRPRPRTRVRAGVPLPSSGGPRGCSHATFTLDVHTRGVSRAVVGVCGGRGKLLWWKGGCGGSKGERDERTVAAAGSRVGDGSKPGRLISPRLSPRLPRRRPRATAGTRSPGRARDPCPACRRRRPRATRRTHLQR